MQGIWNDDSLRFSYSFLIPIFEHCIYTEDVLACKEHADNLDDDDDNDVSSYVLFSIYLLYSNFQVSFIVRYFLLFVLLCPM